MRMFKYVSAVAICTTALSPIAATSALATATQVPIANAASVATLAAMQTQCTALALAHDIDGVGTGDIWTGVVVEGATTLTSGPTEVANTRTNKHNIVGTGTFTPSHSYIQGNPFRIGGSVNMFGDQYADSGSWSDHTYDYSANFDSTFAHAFSCNINKALYHPSYVIPGHPVQGYYVIHPDNHGNEEGAVQQSCVAFSAKQPTSLTDTTVPWWGYVDPDPLAADHGQCDFVKTGDATVDVTVPESWDLPAFVVNEVGTPVSQSQTDVLSGHEEHGGFLAAPGGIYHIGQVVICISPSTTGTKGVPGVWKQQNGYTGPNCTTDWFKNYAVWGSGTESSNGTYISVPNY